jgi:hypothetical protein
MTSVDRAILAGFAQADLERIRVLGIQARIPDEDVLLVEEYRERIQLLRAWSANAP